MVERRMSCRRVGCRWVTCHSGDRRTCTASDVVRVLTSRRDKTLLESIIFVGRWADDESVCHLDVFPLKVYVSVDGDDCVNCWMI